MSAIPAQPERLGRYEIISSLARGGMAELYLARLPGVEGFAKRVVIKRVLPELARDREFVEMLIAEARLAAQLDHQNIVHVHDIGHDAGSYFFAMELLHGADLATLLRAALERDGELPLGIALEIARGACAGLHYAHERTGADGAPLGLVHRDVSPQNLFVTFDGAVKLLDFGIARAVEKISNHYTRSGTLRGKVPYMSPEQCQAEDLDRRSDVFSLAIVLWEMTVGARLFGAAGEGDFAVLKSIVDHDAPAPSTRKAGYPPELERIVTKGLCRERGRRYQTADELHADLERFIRERSLWTSARDLASFMVSLFPDRAAAWKQSEHETRATGGEIVPFPKQPRQTLALAPAPPTSPVAAPEAAPSNDPSSSDRSLGPSPSGDQKAPSSSDRASGRRRAVWIAIAVAAVASALGGGFLLGRSGQPAAAPPAAPASVPVVEDVHWIQSDDYFVHKERYRGGRLDHVRIAKMTSPPVRPGARTAFIDAEGVELETEHYWKTRIARPADLVVGALAFCRVDPHMRTGKKPEDRDEARTRGWTLAKITEVAQVDAGVVSVGPVACDLDAVRVIVP